MRGLFAFSLLAVLAAFASARDRIAYVDDFGAVANDGKPDHPAIQAAIDSDARVIQFGPGVYEITDTIDLQSGKTYRGAGMRATEIYIAHRITGFDFHGKSFVTLEDFGITHRARKPKYGGGGYGLDGGRGDGSQRDSKHNTIQRVWIHDINSAGLICFSGCEFWTVRDCVIERTGRGGFTGNGICNSRVIGNHIAETGDDGIGFNGSARGNTVVGNTFYRCGDVGVTPAAGIKCHGTACTFTGNTFDQCHNAITFQREVTTPDDSYNLAGANQYNVFAENTIYLIGKERDFEVGAYDGRAIKVKVANHIKLTNNYVYTVTPDGIPRCPLWIMQSRNVESSGNTYIGGQIEFGGAGDNENVVFYRDTFLSLNWAVEDIHSNPLIQVGHSIGLKNLVVDACKIDPNIGCLIRSYKESDVTARIENCRLGDSMRIGFIGVDGPLGRHSLIPLSSSKSPEYDGLRVVVPKGKHLRLKGTDVDIPLIATKRHEAGENSLRVQPFELDTKLKARRGWIEWGPSPPMSGKERVYFAAPSSALIEVQQENNDLPGTAEAN